MTTLNTIIEEEKEKFEDTAGYNYNLYLAGTVRRADTGEDWTFEQADKELKNFLTTAMQRVAKEVREERDTYWKERVYGVVSEWVTHNAKTIQHNNGATEYIEVRELLTLLDNLK